MKSLRGFMLGAAFLVSLILLVGVTGIGSYYFEKVISDRSKDVADALSRQVFNSMYQVMKRGWTRQELEEFVDATRHSFADSPMKVHIYRNEPVSALFGSLESTQPDPHVAQVFAQGKVFSHENEYMIRQIYPVKARTECLQCHSNVKNGAILGAISIEQDLESSISSTKKEFYLFVLLISPIPFLIALLVARIFSAKLERSLEKIQDSVHQINSVNDLKMLDYNKLDMGLVEFNRIFLEVEQLIVKLRDIAADKDLLEFEVKLMDKFIIASDVIKDWKEHVKELLLEINTIMQAYSLFVVFKIEDEVYDIQIFWQGNPTEDTIAMFEESVRNRVMENPYFSALAGIAIHHHIANPAHQLPSLSEKDIEFQTKSLILATPKIGGVVGIGVQSELGQDPTRYIVIESILTTLINVIGSVRAIHKYTKDLEYYATRDPLTNLFNQRMFRELIHYEVGRAKRHGYKFALFMIDFDNFKYINDTFGHEFGDRFLQSYADIVRQSIRQEDILSRYGGDEFAIILPNADTEQAFLVAGKIKEAVGSFSLDSPTGEHVSTTVSIGIAIFPDHGRDEKELFLLADNMMYKAKQAGKNEIGFPDDKDITETFRSVERKTQIVLQTLDEGKLLPYFQPIVNLKNGDVMAHELLMRIDYSGEIHSATTFIEVAERLGMIHKMDFILIEKAFQKIHEEQYRQLLFINLSTKSLIANTFMNDIMHLCHQYQVDPSQIVFEINENDISKNISLLEKFTGLLKMEGFQLSIDDFGSALASFHYIKRLPISFLKVDGDLTRGLLNDHRDSALIKGIVTIAKEMNIEVVAENIEVQETQDLIASMDIQLGQGYHLGRPEEHLESSP